jgi:hypothetical protein
LHEKQADPRFGSMMVMLSIIKQKDKFLRVSNRFYRANEANLKPLI